MSVNHSFAPVLDEVWLQKQARLSTRNRQVTGFDPVEDHTCQIILIAGSLEDGDLGTPGLAKCSGLPKRGAATAGSQRRHADQR